MFIRVAVVEDSTQDQIQILQLLNEWMEQSKHHLEVSTFEDSNKLLGAIDEAYGLYDVYLLDIGIRQPQEGLELAMQIRVREKELPIIFVSSRRELALQSYDVHALHFITKPIDKSRFFAAIDRLMDIMDKRKTNYLSFIVSKETRSMPLYEVIWISTSKSDGHYLVINGDPDTRFEMRLDDLVATHSDDLVRCHKSHIVNIAHIRRITPLNIVLSNGTELPVGRVYLQNVRACFAAYHRVERGN